jgi:hypothetical protein
MDPCIKNVPILQVGGEGMRPKGSASELERNEERIRLHPSTNIDTERAVRFLGQLLLQVDAPICWYRFYWSEWRRRRQSHISGGRNKATVRVGRVSAVRAPGSE